MEAISEKKRGLRCAKMRLDEMLKERGKTRLKCSEQKKTKAKQPRTPIRERA